MYVCISLSIYMYRYLVRHGNVLVLKKKTVSIGETAAVL